MRNVTLYSQGSVENKNDFFEFQLYLFVWFFRLYLQHMTSKYRNKF